MRLIAKVLLIALGSLLLLVALLIFGANLYVQSTLSQARIETEISRAIQVPVKITSTTVSPWRGLAMNGITVAQPEGTAEGNFFNAKDLVVHFKFWPIFRRQFVIEEIVLSEPTLAWWQDKKGRWEVPRTKEEPIAPTSETPSPLAEATPSAMETPSQKTTTAETKERGPKFDVQLQNVRVVGGNFYFYNRDGHPIASAESVNITAPEPTENRVEGQATIGTATLPGPVVIEQISTPFVYKKGHIKLPHLTARVADGDLSGEFQAETGEDSSPFHVSLQFSQIDVRALLAQLTRTPLDLQGRATGWTVLSGPLAHAEAMIGGGQISITGAQMRNTPLLQMLGDVLKIDEFSVMNLQTAQLDFRVFNKRIWVDSLVLQSQNLRLLIWGSAKMGGNLKMQGQLTINSVIGRQLPQFVEQNFDPVAGTDQRSVTFNITGKYNHPQTDLSDKVLGKALEKKAGKVMELLRGFMGGGAKKEQGNGP